MAKNAVVSTFSQQHDPPVAIGDQQAAIGSDGGRGPDRRLGVVIKDQMPVCAVDGQDVPDRAPRVQSVRCVQSGRTIYGTDDGVLPAQRSVDAVDGINTASISAKV